MKEPQKSCAIAVIAGIVFLGVIYSVIYALGEGELNQRKMLCNSAEVSGNKEQTAKCLDPEYLELKN